MPERKAAAGFTLLELMVVIAILGLLATIVVPSVLGHDHNARMQKAAVDVRQIYDAAVSFRIKRQRWPRSLEELISGRPPEIDGYRAVPKDPWGQIYRIEAAGDRFTWVVVSWGPDGVEGSDDDIKSSERDAVILSGESERDGD